MTSYALLFTLSCLGISETVYLIKKRLMLQRPICPVGENCAIVLESKYNHLLIIPNDVLGLLFYIACVFITVFLVLEIYPTWLFGATIALIVGLGSLLSVFFTYLQFNIIKAWCFWCLMSACTIWAMGVIITINRFLF